MVKNTIKKWGTPKLVVLERSNPEEAVLAGCKLSGSPIGEGSSSLVAGCRGQVTGQTDPCHYADCSPSVSS